MARRQRGMVTLLVSLVLLFAVTGITLSSSRTAVMEQRVANNEYRASEAHMAAEAGLDYALAWLAVNSWDTGDAVPAVPSITAGNGDTYTATLALTRFDDYVRVTSTARAGSDSTITASVQQFVFPKTLLNNVGVDAPPIVVDGCTSGITGTPDIYPADSGGVALATTQSNDGSCVNTGHFTLNNSGTIAYDQYSSPVWDHLFNISKAEFQASADHSFAGSGPLYYIDSNSNWGGSTIGSTSAPVVIYFDVGAAGECPGTTGGTTVYGVLYFDLPDDQATCSAGHPKLSWNSTTGRCGCDLNGLGNTDVHGSLIVEGDLTKANANTNFYDWDYGGGNGGMPNLPQGSAVRLIGTWKDF